MAFEPPSDYVPEGKASGAKKIWMVLGGGCLLVLIVIGIAFAAGAFKAVSCCSDFQNVAKRSIEVQKFGSEFATRLYRGENKSAYEMSSDAFKSDTSFEAFDKAVRAHEGIIKSSIPRLDSMNVIQTPGEGFDVKAWKATYAFARPTDEEMVVMSVDISSDESDPPAFAINAFDLDIRTRDLASEAPAVEVAEFHRELQRGNYEMAFGRLGQDFKKETDFATFKAFLDDQGAMMTDSRLEIQEVAYPEVQRATVIAITETDDKHRALVQYELVSIIPNTPSWQIMAISPMIEPEPEPARFGADAGAPDAATTD